MNMSLDVSQLYRLYNIKVEDDNVCFLIYLTTLS
jgi:hypothetical protein